MQGNVVALLRTFGRKAGRSAEEPIAVPRVNASSARLFYGPYAGRPAKLWVGSVGGRAANTVWQGNVVALLRTFWRGVKRSAEEPIAVPRVNAPSARLFYGPYIGRLAQLSVWSIGRRGTNCETARSIAAVLWAVTALLALCNPALAQSEWRLTTADFQSSTIDVQSIDDKTLHGTAPTGEDRAVPLTQLLEVSRTLPPHADGGAFVLFLQGGDRLGGAPVAMTGEQLQWHSAALGDIQLPIRRLIAIGAAGVSPPAQGGTDDAVMLANNDQLHGVVTALGAGKVSVQGAIGNNDIPLASVRLISFAASAGKRDPHQAFRVCLDDGTAIATESIGLDGAVLHFKIAGNALGSIDLARVTAIEQVNGPVSWLSVRPPSENVYVPFISPGQPWPAQMDRSVTGEPIVFRDQSFAHGIGVHACSRLSWPLDGTWTAFRTQYAIDGDDAESLAADVTVRIKLDGKVVFEQQHVHGGLLSPIVVQQLESAKTLTLEADFGDRMDTRARLNWIEPALLKNTPTPQVGTALPTSAKPGS